MHILDTCKYQNDQIKNQIAVFVFPSGCRIDLLKNTVNLRLSFYDLFNSKLNIANVPSQFSLKIAMPCWFTSF